MAVPHFNHELPALRRKGSFSWSLGIHAAGIALLLTAAHWLPEAHILRRQTEVVPIYVPPVESAPVPKIVPPPPQVLAKLSPPRLALPVEPPKIEPPKIEPRPFDMAQPVPPPPKMEPKKEIVTGSFASNVPVAAPVRPKEVVANSFASGSSAQATLSKTPREVQTGGFGDPNGVKGTSDRKGQVMVASLGGFDLPSGPGQGNGTGGSRGARGTVASAGFGNGAAGNGNGDRPRGGAVAQAGFNQMAAVPATRERAPEKPAMTPVEITYKPLPVYTQEARQLRLEGEVLVQVMFTAGGDLRVQQVVRGLGHGLDEAAVRAARQIRFRPARRNGEPYDSVALVHIVFALAQ